MLLRERGKPVPQARLDRTRLVHDEFLDDQHAPLGRLGIIVAGGELSRLFGDLGAEVIKVESAGYPDGLRQGRPGQILSE